MSDVGKQDDSPEPSPERLDLARRITHWREAAGMRKIDLARELAVEPAMVTKWEQGDRAPTIENQHRIAAACGVSFAVFWSRLPVPGGKSAGETD